MTPEKRFETKIKKYLSDHNSWFVKYWGGGTFTRSGVPDLLVCCEGRFLGIEVKAEDGRPSDLQIYNLKEIDRSGGFGILLYPKHWELFKNFIDCLKAGDTENTEYNYQILKRVWEE